MRIVSLFSGAGGLDYGLKKAGHEIVWANDIDSDSVNTYRYNISENIIEDNISNIDLTTLPDCDAIVGGFPCQGFSQANLQRDIHDSRNQLYKYFLAAVNEVKPEIFIAENVKGILTLANGQAIGRILSDFASIGYTATPNLVNLADYGVPQTRQRVFIIGMKKTNVDAQFTLPQKTHDRFGANNLKKWVSIKEAIDHFSDPDGENDIPNHMYSAYKIAYRNFTGHRFTEPDKPSPTILARGNGKGGVCAIPHYNGKRRLTIRESAAVQTFPDDFVFFGSMTSCYRQVGNAVPCHYAYLLGLALNKMRKNEGN